MKAVILAAGEGVRLRPLTWTKPKSLLPVAGVPLLLHLLKAVKHVGVDEVFLVVGYLGEKIRETLSETSHPSLTVHHVSQKKEKGTGNALNSVERFLEAEEFLTVYGDLYLKPQALERLRNVWKKDGEKLSGLMGVVEVENPQQYGVVKLGSQGNVLNIVEKPKRPLSNLANAGVYVFTQKIFKALRDVRRSSRGEIELTDAVNRMIQEESEPFYAVKFSSEEWLDIGRPWDLLEANKRALKKLKPLRKGRVDRGVRIKGPVRVEAGACLRAGTYVEGPAFFGEGSTVGPNAYIRSFTVIGRNAFVGQGCEVKNSILMDGARVPHLSYVGDSILGENCNLGAGTVVGNVRLDGETVKITVKGVKVDSGLRKLGAILGDHVQTGVNVSLMPGVQVGPYTRIAPGLTVYSDLPPNSFFTAKQSS